LHIEKTLLLLARLHYARAFFGGCTVPRIRRWMPLTAACFVITLLSTALEAQQFPPSLYQEMQWRCIGPFRGGRTVAATGVPNQPNVFYIAANNGGVWKSTDSGHTWQPIFDGQPTGSVGAMAIAPSNPDIIFVGSGEGLQRPDLSVGDGIYKSTDAGATWKHLGLRDAQQISALRVDPRDPNRVYVAVLGHPYGANAERGVFRSLDGGETWEKVLYKDENTGAVALAFDPANPQTIYAVLWAARRPPWTTGSSLEGYAGGLYKSTDGGSTWQPLPAKGLPANADKLGRIGFGIAPSNPQRMYALADAPRVGGLYRSDDAGESWQRVNNEGRIWGRGADFAEVVVDPRNPDEVYVANTSTYRSMDGGRTFLAIKGAPGGDDYHTIWINPGNPDVILLGSDQGATLTVNGGRTWSSWYNQPTAQFYHVSTDNRFPYWVYGGQQESGSASVASRGSDGAITFREFHPVGVEEYGYVAPDPLHPNLVYGGKVTRFNWLTGQTQNVAPFVLRDGTYRFNRTAPLLFSPVDPHILYLGSNVLFKTEDGGVNWQIVSPDLTRKDPGVPPNLGDFVKSDPAHGKHRGVIYSIGPSFRDVNLLWAGTDDGLIWVTRDGGKNWKDVTPPELTPWSKVAQLDASHFDALTVYAAVNRLRLDDLRPYIYRTHDGGKTWQKITQGLPDNAPVNTVREDPVRKNLLFAGTEKSIWVSFDDGDHWQSLQLNLPASSMRDLVVHGDDIVVGTHGRSFWILDDITPLRQISEKAAVSDAYLFRPQLTYHIQRNTNTDTPLPPEEPAGKNPPDGAVLDYLLKSDVANPVTLEIFDGTGKLVRRFSSADKPDVAEAELQKELNVPTYWVRFPKILSAGAGMHRFVWDLHYPAPQSLRHEYPIAAIVHDTPRDPRGPRALPGAYTVKLTVDGKSYQQPLTIKMDPRVQVTQAALAQQFAAESKITAEMNKDFAALQEVKRLREQLKKLAGQAGQGPLAETIAALDAKAAALEGAVAPGEAFGPTTGQENLSRLNLELGTLYRAVDSADAAPTTAQAAASANLEKALASLLARWDALKSHDLPALNQQLQAAGLAKITF
jgi:photosystem II stability/assembly factor-like uncharacterized protein